ncbi:hypothetical protein NQZ68_017880 [Dissostichus eleginoides]|nr:hypothetical protein NQZ68_017880 [Dissostichus eleginoides]
MVLQSIPGHSVMKMKMSRGEDKKVTGDEDSGEEERGERKMRPGREARRGRLIGCDKLLVI